MRNTFSLQKFECFENLINRVTEKETRPKKTKLDERQSNWRVRTLNNSKSAEAVRLEFYRQQTEKTRETWQVSCPIGYPRRLLWNFGQFSCSKSRCSRSNLVPPPFSLRLIQNGTTVGNWQAWPQAPPSGMKLSKWKWPRIAKSTVNLLSLLGYPVVIIFIFFDIQSVFLWLLFPSKFDITKNSKLCSFFTIFGSLAVKVDCL